MRRRVKGAEERQREQRATRWYVPSRGQKAVRQKVNAAPAFFDISWIPEHEMVIPEAGIIAKKEQSR